MSRFPLRRRVRAERLVFTQRGRPANGVLSDPFDTARANAGRSNVCSGGEDQFFSPRA